VDDNNKNMGKNQYVLDGIRRFTSRIGLFADRNYIFNSHHVDLKEGRVFMWHKKESLCYTQEFGCFACRVKSKILGIVTAERS
jgi:hypothetical protein